MNINLPTSIVPCPLCGHYVMRPVFQKNGFKIVRCSVCNLLHVNPMPTVEALQKHYQNSAYFDGALDQGYQNYADMEKALRPHFQRRLRKLAQRHRRGRLLDFGCAAGYFLKMARNEGWEINGIELSESMATIAVQTSHAPIARTLGELPSLDFDAVTLWEVIEHLPRPIEELQRLYASLNPGGVLMLSTPNTGHWQVTREPEQWEGFRPPSHLLFFTVQTICEMLTRVGFASITIEKVSPLPLLPNWLQRISASLQTSLSTGQARFWRTSLFTWRTVRALGYVWDRIIHPGVDVFATLEVIAFKPNG